MAYFLTAGPVKNAVSPIGTGWPLGVLSTMLCWTGSWLSNSSVNGVSAFVSAAFGSKPEEAAPTGAVIFTTGAFGSIDAAGAWLPLAPPPSASSQQSGNGVAPGAGLNLGSRQPLNVSSLPVAGSMTGSFRTGSLTTNVSVLGARMNAIRASIWT